MPHKDPKTISRKRGKDKQRDRFNKFGKSSSKHIRARERLLQSNNPK